MRLRSTVRNCARRTQPTRSVIERSLLPVWQATKSKKTTMYDRFDPVERVWVKAYWTYEVVILTSEVYNITEEWTYCPRTQKYRQLDGTTLDATEFEQMFKLRCHETLTGWRERLASRKKKK